MVIQTIETVVLETVKVNCDVEANGAFIEYVGETMGYSSFYVATLV